MRLATGKDRSQLAGIARVGGDATSVALGQVSAFLYPLVSVPYLSRIFGIHGLGQLLLAMSIINVLVLVVDFGFGMSALRRVALAETKQERALIVSSTLAAKVLLLACGASILCLLVLVLPELRAHWQLYLVGALLTIGAVAYPPWLLQGIGKIKTFAALHAVSRIMALIGLLLTVHHESDTALAIFWQFVPATFAAIGSWILLSSIGIQCLVHPTWRAAIDALADSGPLFIGSVATIVISAMNTVFLGMFSTIQQVAYYGSGERLSNAVRGVLGGVQQAMLPRVSSSVAADDGQRLCRTVVTGLVIIYGLSGLALVLLAGIIVPWYLGDAFSAAVPVARLLGIAVCLTGVSTALTLLLIAHGQAALSTRVLLRAAIVHVLMMPLASTNLGALGAAAALCVTELLIAVMLARSFSAFRRRAAAANASRNNAGPGGNRS